jgi:hypothetical protein
VSTVRWVSIVMHEHTAPDLEHARLNAMIAWGSRVLHTQSLASWEIGVADESARLRNVRLNIEDVQDEDDGA